MSRSLAGLLRSLRQAGLDIDAEAALDSLWLGLQVQARQRASDVPSAVEPADGGASGRSALPPEGGGRGDTREPAVDRSRARDRLAAERAAQRARAEVPRADVPASGRVFTLSRAAALPESRELVKALRPLRRRVVSPGPGTLDLNTTVRRAAEEDLWIPSFASTRERWLDVLLVADHGLSMILWKDTIDEFERVLATSGAFRSVRSWWLESDAAQPAIAARGRGPNPATPERLARLTRGIGRSVVVVVSDCVGARWHDGTIPGLMAEWARVVPVALTQVTPEWFWARTALGDTVRSEFRSTIPAAMNHRFRWDPRALGAGVLSPEEDKTLFRVPAVTLTAAAVARLSGLIAGVGREWAPGVVFDLAWKREEEQTSRLSVTADERVARFTALASTEAKRLAAAFAACPLLTLGVLRLLRRDLVPEAGPFVEAEVLLGGITRVKREQARWDLGASLPLEFVPGVQWRLLDGALAGDVLRVLAHAAAIAETGVGPTFSAWLDNPSSAAAKLDPAESPFAAAVAHVLERLGGTYAQMVTTRSRPVEDVPPEPDAGESSREFNGWPHEVPVPEVLVGRTPELERLGRWLDVDPLPRVPTLVGPMGIGKSAIAGHLIRRSIERHPGRAVFSWCFQRDPSSGEALRALRNFILGEERKDDLGDGEALKIALARRPEPRLVILDGLDGITDPTELSQVLTTAELVLSSGHTHILLTTRAPLPETPLRMSVDVVEVGRLDDASVEELVDHLLSVARVGAFDRDALSIVQRLSGGYPLLVEFVVERARRLTPQGLFEEFGFLYREGDSIDPRALPSVAETLDRAERARALADEARSLLETDAAKAVEAFGEVVELRRGLPSIAGKAQAFFEYGEASLSVAHYQRAGSSLEEALEIYRSVSDDREIIPTLDRLSEVRLALGRPAEALSLLEEALALRRRLNEPEEIYNGLLRLAAAEAGQQRWGEAIAHYQEATHVEGHADGGAALLGAARAQQGMGDVAAALSSAQQAVRLFEIGEDRTSSARALDLIAQLQESAGDYSAARRTLGRLKQLQTIKVYLSSTLGDLEAERAAVKEVLGHKAIVKDASRVGEDAIVQDALRELAECDLYVLVLGLRYGFVPPGETKSITHLEYAAATARGLPRLVFVKREAAIPYDLTDAVTQAHVSPIEAFRKEVLSEVVVGLFDTVDELKLEVLHAFTDFRTRTAVDDTDPEIDQRLRRLASIEASQAGQSASQTARPAGDVRPADDQVVTAEFLISGRVQGVGFRQFGQQAARELGAEGRVENLPDGRIRVRATGPRARLKRLEERLRQGPSGARVEQVSTTILEDESPAAIDSADSSTRALLAIGIGSTGKLPRLPGAVDAARRVAEWAGSQGISRDLIWLLTDDRGPVNPVDIVDIVRSAVERGTLRQLIVYFAGYAVGIDTSETWLLSKAPEDPQAAVNLEMSVALARYAGIPHIVFVSDSCRVAPESIAAQRVTGTLLFPRQSEGQTAAAIDRFAADVVGPRAWDVKDVNEAARSYSALYTSALLSALSGVEPNVLDERDGVTFVRPRTLKRYLDMAIDERQREHGIAIGAQQRPSAIIESDPDAWIARFPAPRPRPQA